MSPSIHILNGHVIGMKNGNKNKFRNLLKNLSKKAELIKIEQACTLIKERRVVGHPMIAFTFDDGYEDCYTDIAPVLEEFGVNAAFFINPNFSTGDDLYIENFLKGKTPDIPFRRPMTIQMLKELSDRGFVIGAHTLDHEKLIATDNNFLKRQIVDCRYEVEKITGVPCEYFAWTYGRFQDICEDAIKMALDTYKFVFSSDNYEFYTSRGGKIINRRHFECDWPSAHVYYFLSKKRSIEA